MFIEDRIKLFTELGKRLNSLSEEKLEELAVNARNQNSWFTKSSVQKAISGISSYLEKSVLESWLSKYALENTQSLNIGVVAAGNIPLVGFHDILCVLVSGHHLMVKLSSSDNYLMRYVLQELINIDDRVEHAILIVDRLNEADAYIATGSDNTARYFKYYFKEKPHVIRSNRTSVAILQGNESGEDLYSLGDDIFQYYGLGCRNVSKILLPINYDIRVLIDALQEFQYVLNHHKYRNNYDYNKSIYLVNGEKHFDSGFFLMRQSSELVSPISVLYFDFYNDANQLESYLSSNEQNIQCAVGESYIPFGEAQSPAIDDYADGVDTLSFLSKIS